MKNLLSGPNSSKTRVKLLTLFFLEPDTHSYLREIAKEFGVSTKAVRGELNQLTKTILLKSYKNRKQIRYTANTDHALFPGLKSMVSKVVGIDQVMNNIIPRLGNSEKAYLIYDYAEGKDTGIIDLLLVGDIDQYLLNDLSRKTERYIKRKIRSLVLTSGESSKFQTDLKNRLHILIWKKK